MPRIALERESVKHGLPTKKRPFIERLNGGSSFEVFCTHLQIHSLLNASQVAVLGHSLEKKCITTMILLLISEGWKPCFETFSLNSFPITQKHFTIWLFRTACISVRFVAKGLYPIGWVRIDRRGSHISGCVRCDIPQSILKSRPFYFVRPWVPTKQLYFFLLTTTTLRNQRKPMN